MIANEDLMKANLTDIEDFDLSILEKKLSELTVKEFLILTRSIIDKKNPFKEIKINEIEAFILDKIQKTKNISAYSLAKELGIKYDKTKKIMKRLVSKGKLLRTESLNENNTVTVSWSVVK